ncbi:MAG: hypothetical protein IAE82_12600 [Opitutaceae bacterium]|nr:hypothetical protein [Opitutaceae bacterium]
MSHTPSTPPTPDPEDPWLEKILREPAPTPRGTDDTRTAGAAAFTDRVLAALPPPTAATRRATRRRRALLLAGATALGCGVAWLCGGAAVLDSLNEAEQVIRSAGAQFQGSERAAMHVLAGLSAVAMLWFFGRRDLRRLF